MARRPYRIEVNFPTRGKPQYYLVRDVKVGDRRGKVKKYLGTVQPTQAEVEHHRERFAPDMELKAALKKAEMSSVRYKSSNLATEQVKQLEEIRWVYSILLELLTTNEVEVYERDFEINYVHGTTSIEGNTLTLREASDLLEHGITPQGKSLREINEVQNFRKVAKYRNGYKGKVTLDFIRNLHALVEDNIDNESAGSFRRADDVAITGSEIRLAPAIQIEEELSGIIGEYYSQLENSCHPFELAAVFHHKFETIHPFTDGNGRVGREIFNYMLTRTKFPRLLFIGKDRDQYISALRLGDKGDYAGMVAKFTEIIVRQRLAVLRRRLEIAASTTKKRGQLRLTDFVAA